MFAFRFKSYWILFWGPNWQYPSIGSGYGLVPNSQQAITWTNDDPVVWPIYALQNLNVITDIVSFKTRAPIQYKDDILPV